MKILKNKKGLGMEMAIVMLVVVFAFCTLITTIAYSLSVSKKREYDDLKQRVTLDRIGESFLSVGVEAVVPEGSDYTLSFENENKTLKVKSGEEVVFIVQVDGENNVTRWQYLFN